jgi:hypothetical protein
MAFTGIAMTIFAHDIVDAFRWAVHAVEVSVWINCAAAGPITFFTTPFWMILAHDAKGAWRGVA